MSTSEPASKINLGFHGGGVLTARVRAAELTKLREALGAGGGWHELAADTGTVVLDLARIDYLLIDDEKSRVGF
jgi:hypothetical protein